MADDPLAHLRIDKLALMEQNKGFEAKKWVWITDKQEGYKAAEVKATKGDVYTIETNAGDVSYKVLPQCNFTHVP